MALQIDPNTAKAKLEGERGGGVGRGVRGGKKIWGWRKFFLFCFFLFCFVLFFCY